MLSETTFDQLVVAGGRSNHGAPIFTIEGGSGRESYVFLAMQSRGSRLRRLGQFMKNCFQG